VFCPNRKEVISVSTRDDVARKAGVSGATVSRVFNNPDSVSDITREKVLKAAKELSYHPNIIASNFVKGISGNIGVVIPRIHNIHMLSVYYFAELLSGIGDALSKENYNLLLFYHDLNTIPGNIKYSGDGYSSASCNREYTMFGSDYEKYFIGKKVDGCILLGTYANDPSLLSLKKEGYKFCLVNNYIKNSGISFVDIDNIKGSFDAVEHLINLGHRDIAFLNGPMYYMNSIDRLKGYKKALETYNIPFNNDMVFEGNYGRKSGYYTSEKILSLKKIPSSVFVSNDRMAAGLLQGLLKNGIKVPQDISIVGYDNSDIATIVTPQLTTVHTPLYELGYKCAYEFINYVKNDNYNFELFIPPKLVVRNSTINYKILD
jgi:LacI family transcriptional regulator